MATKKRSSSKKASARKKPLVGGVDPPIVVSGGGGNLTPRVRGRAMNMVFVGFHPKGGLGVGRFPSEVNEDAEITSVEITFPKMIGLKPIILSDKELYNIQIEFKTAPKAPPLKRGAKASRKGKSSSKRR